MLMRCSVSPGTLSLSAGTTNAGTNTSKQQRTVSAESLQWHAMHCANDISHDGLILTVFRTHTPYTFEPAGQPGNVETAAAASPTSPTSLHRQGAASGVSWESLCTLWHRLQIKYMCGVTSNAHSSCARGRLNDMQSSTT